jgi:hypothetical protein
MSTRQQTESSRTNQLTAGPPCDHCEGVTSHETWCITCNAVVRYAYGVVVDSSHLTLGDELSLHALGVRWSAEASKGNIRRQ